MKPDTEFVYETTSSRNSQWILLSILGGIGLLVFIIDATHILSNAQSLGALKDHILKQIGASTAIGLLYIGFIGGLFFVPAPLEAFFIAGLRNGNDPFITCILFSIGLLVSQAVNYIIGARLSTAVMAIISKKQVFKARRWVSRYGGWAVFLCAVLPFSPLQPLTFALGITRYNIMRLFTLIIVGTVIKLGAMVWIA